MRHAELDECLEERWLFEAITECYLPLLSVCERLIADNIAPRITFSLSPTLLEMLGDELLRDRYQAHLENTLTLCDKECDRTRKDPVFAPLAEYYRTKLTELHHRYTAVYQRDLCAAFVRLKTHGVELISTCATHAFLPLLADFPEAVKRQITLGIKAFEAHTASKPAGFWLPECAYYEGLDELLAEKKLPYTILDTHGIEGAEPPPPHGTYAPIRTHRGTCYFGRDPASARQVWSSQSGYPGDYEYREFYKDIGHDLPLDYLAPHLIDGKIRTDTGLKYYRTSGSNKEKEPYDPAAALLKAQHHARDFVSKKHKQAESLKDTTDSPAFIAPFDTELFGHWWYEGPQWLEAVCRLCAKDDKLKLSTPSEIITATQPIHEAQPATSTWGEAGFNRYWLNADNDWVQPQIAAITEKTERLLKQLKTGSTDHLHKRAILQALRNTLLAQASDWAFLLHSHTAPHYAEKRLRDHIARVYNLDTQLQKNHIDKETLVALELLDPIFASLHDFQPS